MTRRTFAAAVAAITLISVVRVASTARIFAQVIDEPVHIAAGYEWLATGKYRFDVEHPPLARAMLALPLWMSGVPEPSGSNPLARANSLLLYGGRYEHNLALARAGNLLFLALAIIVAALWAAHLAGEPAGIVAALIFASITPILGHAGVATTDMAAAATIPLALYALTLWLDSPTPGRAVILGFAIGIGMMSKFSFLVFFPAGALVVMWFHRRRVPAAHVLLSLAVAFAVVCAAYRLDFAPLIRGLVEVQRHNTRGHSAFLFGEVSRKGWWYYFPVAVLFKSPLAVMALAAAALFTRARETALVAIAILAASMPASINIGVRHVLPIYAPMAIAGAIFVANLRARWLMPGAIVVVAASSAVVHPDYIASFNLLAGRHPERILVDSNLDWGQDVLRLRRVCREKGIRELNALVFSSADLAALGFPPIRAINPTTPSHGWLAISETPYAIAGGATGDAFRWLNAQPYQRVGKSIRLYYLP